MTTRIPVVSFSFLPVPLAFFLIALNRTEEAKKTLPPTLVPADIGRNELGLEPLRNAVSRS